MRHLEQGGARELVDAATSVLDAVGIENARLDAELMLGAASGRSRTDILLGKLTLDAIMRQKFAAMVERRHLREPLAYILGHKEFYSIELEVTSAVLIPRPETEFVVGEALRILSGQSKSRVLDLCTGSGAIALAIAANAPQTKVVATDLSSAALKVAQSNVERLGLRDRVTFRQADGFDPIDSLGPLGRFNLIVSNPPYIPEADIDSLQPEVSRWEPRIALDGGADGLAFYRRIANGLPTYLEKDGWVVVEVGAGQADAASRIFRESGIGTIATIPDLSGIPRVVSGHASAVGRPPSIR